MESGNFPATVPFVKQVWGKMKSEQRDTFRTDTRPASALFAGTTDTRHLYPELISGLREALRIADEQGAR